MFFDVKRTARFTVDDESILKFKTAVAEYLTEEADEKGPFYTADDIPDSVVEEVLKDAIQEAYQEGDDGFVFDEYFMSVSLIMGEDGTSDAVYEAAGLFHDKIKEAN